MDPSSRTVFKEPTSWLQSHVRPGAGHRKASCFQIPDPQKEIPRAYCSKPQYFGAVCRTTTDNSYSTQYYTPRTPLDSGFQLCSANAQTARPAAYSSALCSGRLHAASGCSSPWAPIILFLPFGPSRLPMVSDLILGFLTPAHSEQVFLFS